MDYRIAGARTIVTGAGGAILGAVARQAAREGAIVAVWDVVSAAAQRTAAAIVAAGGSAVAVECDVTDHQSIAAAVARTVDAIGGPIDILVNGAGGSSPRTTTGVDRSFFDIEPEAMRAVVDLNYLSVVLCCQAVGQVLAADAAVVNISSVAGFAPLSRAVGYCNAKAAVNSLTQWLAVHMARTYHPSIRVNAVAPGFVLTEQNRFLLVDSQTGDATERGGAILAAVPAGRYGDAEEIAAVVIFLASKAASYVNGAIVVVDGGFAADPGV